MENALGVYEATTVAPTPTTGLGVATSISNGQLELVTAETKREEEDLCQGGCLFEAMSMCGTCEDGKIVGFKFPTPTAAFEKV